MYDVEIGDIYKDWQGNFHALVLDEECSSGYLCLHLESGQTRYLQFGTHGWIKVG